MAGNITLSTQEIIHFFSIIENHVKFNENFSLYKPSNDFNSRDIISVQKEAKRMMDFVKMSGYTTIITFVNSKPFEAGSINLNHDKEVFIEIDRKILERDNSNKIVLCVMAHEICHKLLYTHGLYLSNTKDNEICTDLATVYVGFGELSINGCYDHKSWTDYKPDGSYTIHTDSYTTGYLDLTTFKRALTVIVKSFDFKKTKIENVSSYNLLKLNEELYFRTFEQFKHFFIYKSKNLSRSLKLISEIHNLLSAIEENIKGKLEVLDHDFRFRLLDRDIYDKHLFETEELLQSLDKKIWFPDYKQLENVLVHLLAEYPVVKYKDLYDGSITCPFCGNHRENKNTSEPVDLSIQKCKCGRVFTADLRLEDDPSKLWVEPPKIKVVKEEVRIIEKKESFFKRLFSFKKKK